MLDKKGFLFTVTIFLVLMYILLSISVWVKSVETSEQSFSEFYKESTVELAIDQITPAKLDNVSYVIMNRNLLRLNDNSIDNPLKAGPAGDENKEIRQAMGEMLMYGNASETHFVGQAVPVEYNTSLSAWAGSLNASLRSIGVYIDYFNVSNFELGQDGLDKVNYSFDLDLGIKDVANTSAITRSYHIQNEVSVSGLVDPALARLTKSGVGENETVYRQFFFKPDLYPNESSMLVQNLGQSVEGGQGWVYGPLAMASGSADDVPDGMNSLSPSARSNYILVGNYSDIMALSPDAYDMFAGFIVTSVPDHPSNCSSFLNEQNTFNPITYQGKSCAPVIDGSAGALTNKPFIIAPGFSPASAPICPVLIDNSTMGRCVLMLNNYLPSDVNADPAKKLAVSGSGLFNLESLRDFTMCGYYTHSPSAPSYLQHLLVDSYSRNDSLLGIETFVVGNYASDYSKYDNSSRLDRELLNTSIAGVKIRGMPGCKDFASCSDSPPTGIFSASEQAIADFGLGSIACDNGAAGCN